MNKFQTFFGSNDSHPCFSLGYRINGTLIGDTGYALRPWLMTPIPHPASRAERRYNSSLSRTRVIIEQVFGQLKRRFPCLSIGLRVCPVRATTIVLACTVLHNMAKDYGEPDVEDDDEENDDDDEVEVPPYVGELHDGQLHRNRIINQHFNRA